MTLVFGLLAGREIAAHFHTEDSRLRHVSASNLHDMSINDKLKKLHSLQEHYYKLNLVVSQQTEEIRPFELGCSNPEDFKRNQKIAIERAKQTSDRLQQLQLEIDLARAELDAANLEYQRRFSLLEFDLRQRRLDFGPP